VVLLLDGDETGRMGSDRAAAGLLDVRVVRVVRLPADAQPDQLPAERLRELLESVMASIGSSMARTN